jgi:hypothetical protein
MEYDAFISYRRADGSKAARWLRRALQHFRAPKRLAHLRERKLKIYLDTAYERGTSDFYAGTIRPALLASRHLIVVATPDAVKRPAGGDDWIVREIEDFTAGPNAANLMVVRGAGLLDDPLPGDLKERFPNIEIVDLRKVGPLWFLHPMRAARISAEKLKLVAPLLDVALNEMPVLRQEEERAQQVRLGVAAGATLAVVVAVTGLSAFALQSRWRAQQALDVSLYSAMRVVGQVADGLTGDNDREIRSQLLNQACDLVDRLSSESRQEPSADASVTCMIERAASRERLGEKADAEVLLDDAIAAADARYAADRHEAVALTVARAYDAMAALYAGRKDTAKQRAALEKEVARISGLGDELDSAPLLVRTADAEWDLAGVLSDGGEIDGAVAMAHDMVAHLMRADRLTTSGQRYYAERAERVLVTVGNVETNRGRQDKAVAAFRQAVAIGVDLRRSGGATMEGRLVGAEAMAALVRADATDALRADLKGELTFLKLQAPSMSDGQRQRLATVESDYAALIASDANSPGQSAGTAQ